MVGFIPPTLKHSIHIVTEPCVGHYLLFHGQGSCFKSHKKSRNAHIFIPPLLFRIVFSIFTQFLHPTIEYIYISQIFIMAENKELYEAPTLTAVELKQEGVICASPNPNYNPWDNQNW